MMILSDYNPAWKDAFHAFARIYGDALGDLITRIEHVGSTAIVGIAAKPIIDIDLVMADYSKLPAISAKLAALGYRHNGDQGIPQREAFNRLDDKAPWTGENRAWLAHNLYLCPEDSRELWRHVTFRDYLNQHEAARLEYERIKRDIEARAGGDRKVYAGIKENEGVCSAFVERVLNAAGG